MCAMGAIVQQNEQNIKKFRCLRTLATFRQFGLQNVWHSALALYAIPMGNLYWQFLMKKKCTISLLSPRPRFPCNWYSNYSILKFQLFFFKLFVDLENDCLPVPIFVKKGPLWKSSPLVMIFQNCTRSPYGHTVLFIPVWTRGY